MKLQPLPYTSLEPVLSERAIRVHHLSHHQGYIEKLNKTLEKYPQLLQRVGGLYQLLSNPKWIPQDIKEDVINFGGGVWTHDFFWKCLSPNPQSYETTPASFQAEVSNTFGGYKGLREALISSGVKHFGSGWVWLVRTPELRVYSTLNQNTPMMRGHIPLLTIDLWEHAYYLDYQNSREQYLKDIIDLVLDWSVIQ